ncbi:MAG: bifunctional riboflavin kinase/FAD synthetase [Flavobacterium sp.]|uniref:bifunctional riboflavin kinase/FAD synthetase n=1 Tax=Flavobacterium sp. TaxID=239 RepID=UPI0022CA14C3|nr:bifunctional riboflavin kinase/FAD synthetase [Flavobacterium sp.]MCZ8090118.1 bifunctional riboflavin kinase/FAD synthetase [Flavobacterium sp.]MCZ8330206.1 bifunctional riboflavin kinase/FAD synthetase [Flavobacterium sp.]
MKIYQSISDFFCNKKTIITIGTFDGVHIGHKKILEKIIQNSIQNKFESIVLTFFPHPRIVLQTGLDMKQLNTIDEKVGLIRNIGVDNLVIHPFDKVFSQLTAEDFVKQVLVDTFNIQKIVIGYDHRFGKNRTADINDLIAFGNQYNFEVEQISAEELNEVAVSSTKIRSALTEGNIKLANSFLGYNYTITGKVVQGKQLGRTIGFPTANIYVEEDYKLIPNSGVYVVECKIDNQFYFGMMNIGTNPTIENTDLNQKIEVNIFNFDTEIYDKSITVSFLKRIRSEQKFDSLESLKAQIAMDKMESLQFIKKL